MAPRWLSWAVLGSLGPPWAFLECSSCSAKIALQLLLNTFGERPPVRRTAFSIRPLPGFSQGGTCQDSDYNFIVFNLQVRDLTMNNLPGPQRIPPALGEALGVSAAPAHFGTPFLIFVWILFLISFLIYFGSRHEPKMGPKLVQKSVVSGIHF